MSELPDAGSFGAAFVEFMQAMSLVAEQRESEVAVRLREHLGTDPRSLPTTGAEFPLAEHPNLQLALDAVLGDAEHVGFTARHMGFGSIGLAEIVAGQAMTGPITLGPVRYVDVEVGDGRVVQCVESALLLAVTRRPRWRWCFPGAGIIRCALFAAAGGRLARAWGGVGAAARAARGDARAQRVPRPDHLPASRRAGRRRRGPVPYRPHGHADRRDPSRGGA